MPSSQAFVDSIIAEIDYEDVSAKKMFGEYGLYSQGKMFGMICDNQLFIKATAAGLAFAGNIAKAAPYPGAKPALLIKDEIKNTQWLAKLIELSLPELPLPKPKKVKA